MIEITVREHLLASLAVPVLMEVPEEPSGAFVVVQKTGSSRADRIDRAEITAQSYAATMQEAAALNEQVKAAFESMAERSDVGRVALDGDYNMSDTASKRYRYQAIYEITYY